MNYINIGILEGVSGNLIYQHIVNYDKLKFETNIHNIYENILVNNISYSFSNGLAGFSWIISYLNKKEILLFDMNEVFSETDEYLYKWMKQRLSYLDYDFLHGALGVGIYFLTRVSEKKHQHYLSALVEGLDNISIRNSINSIKFISVLNKEKKIKGYNLSLSHGMASIIVFLAKCVGNNIKTKKSKELLNFTMNYLMSCILPQKEKYYSIFPSFISEILPLDSSRLAWCYGDLGIGIAIYQAGIITNNIEWKEFALNVLYQCARRRHLKKNGIVDAGLCHGTAGIGQVFHRMYRYTNDFIFMKAAQYWFNETKKMFKFPDSVENYKIRIGEKSLVQKTNLLVGTTGIKLALYCWENNIDPDWDECLLLS